MKNNEHVTLKYAKENKYNPVLKSLVNHRKISMLVREPIKKNFETERKPIKVYLFKIRKGLLRLLSKKKMNKLKHSENGNRSGNIKFAWWNDKVAAFQKGSSVRDKIAAVISSVLIKGYDLITDNLPSNFDQLDQLFTYQQKLNIK